MNTSISKKYIFNAGKILINVFLSGLCLFGTFNINAKETSKGETRFGVYTGPHFFHKTSNDINSNHLILGGLIDYSFNENFDFIGDAFISLTSSKPLNLGLGFKYRFTDLNSDFSPYIGLQGRVSSVFDDFGDNFNTIGIQPLVGVEHLTNQHYSFYVQLNSAFQSTTSSFISAKYSNIIFGINYKI